jgi:hypothetical protein
MFGPQFSPKKVGFLRLEERDRTMYHPLRDGASSPSHNGDLEDIKSELVPTKKSGPNRRTSIIFLLIDSNILSLIASFTTQYVKTQSSALQLEYAPKSAGTITEQLSDVEVDIDYYRSNHRWCSYSMETL